MASAYLAAGPYMKGGCIKFTELLTVKKHDGSSALAPLMIPPLTTAAKAAGRVSTSNVSGQITHVALLVVGFMR
jgi:hypothetical protein